MHLFTHFTLILTTLMSVPVSAQYSFLGNVEKYQHEGSNLRLYCEDGFQLNISFLQPNMFRAFLLRPQHQEPPLTYALTKTEWPQVKISVEESDQALLVKSDELDLTISKNPCRLTVRNKAGEVLCEDDAGMGIGWDGKEIRNWKALAEDEKFFGLGEKTGPLDKRGREWVMWNTDDPRHDDNSDPVYQSIPFFVGMRDFKAYGIFFNNSYRSKFNLGAGNLRYYSFSAEAGNLDYFFIYGPQVSRVVESYTALTGRTPMPPKWSLGYQQCRWSYYPDTEVLRIAETFREKDIPADVIYLDIHYMDGYRVFTWDPERFPKPATLVKQLRDLGFRVVVIIDPGVKADPEYTVAKQGLAGDHFVKYPDGQVYSGEVWPGESYFPDFSRPETREWWGQQFSGLVETGISGFWNDMNEPAVWGSAFPEEVLFAGDGLVASQKKFHNLYAFLMAKACYDELVKLRPDTRPFVITRAGFAGEQRFTTVWTGDNQATEQHLAMGIRMLLGMGLSGLPFVGPDVGGFSGEPSPELYSRWLQSAVFTPFFRTHTHYGSRDQEPWSFGEETEDISRKFIRKRYEFLPHLYSLLWEAHQTGAPVMRPMFWHEQSDPEVYDSAYSEQFFVGRDLLVAPVTQVGQRLKKVYLPAGEWLQIDTGTIYRGGRALNLDVPLDRLPVFLRAGGILPSRQAQQYVEEKPLTTLTLDVFARGESRYYDLYEDDGETFGYQKGEYRLTRFEQTFSDSQLVLTKSRSRDHYSPPDRTVVGRFHGLRRAPEGIKLGDQKLPAIQPGHETEGYFWDDKLQLLHVHFPDEGENQTLTITTGSVF